MSRRHRDEPAPPSSIRRAVAVTVVLVALRGADPSGCASVAWKAVPDGASLPTGWSMVSNRVFIDNLTSTLAGPTPSASGQRPAVFASLSCYGTDSALAVRRAHEGALAAGASDVTFAGLGDESFVVFSPATSTTILYIRRGSLVAELTAPTSVDRTTLEAIGRTEDAAMVRSLAVSADASAISQPSPTAGASAAPSSAAGPSSSPSGSTPSASPAALSHDAPDLEKLLPSLLGTTALATQSVLGTTALDTGTASQALVASLQKLGKKPADLQIAGAYDPAGALDLHVFAYRVAGVDATDLGRAVIESQLTNTAAQATSSQVTVGGHAITKISYAQGSPVYFYPLNGVVYAIQSADANLVATVLGLLK